MPTPTAASLIDIYNEKYFKQSNGYQQGFGKSVGVDLHTHTQKKDKDVASFKKHMPTENKAIA